jgi:Tat protein translocase TatB subunit
VLQGGEILIILLVALIVFGPERLPELGRKLGRWVHELRTAAREMRAGLEAEVAEVKQAAEELKEPVREVKQTLRDTGRIAKEADPTRQVWVGPQPETGPTPVEAARELEAIERGEDPEIA